MSPETSLARVAPEVAKEWHPTRNGSLKPSTIVAGSKQKVWWKCASVPEHEWQTTAGHRTRRGQGCPYCPKQRLTPASSFAARYPELSSQWDAKKNGTLRPDQVGSTSLEHVWWRCPVASDHRWQAIISIRARDPVCPFCAGRRLCRSNSLEALYPELSAEWHPSKNSKTPREVAAAHARLAWWQCSEQHEWQADVVARTKGGGACLYCAQRLSPANSLSHVLPRIAAEWHPNKNGELRPDGVRVGARVEVWWQCLKAGHEWRARIDDRAVRGAKCPYCAQRAARIIKVSLADRHPELAKQWHPTNNGTLRPTQVAPSTGRKVWWRCPKDPTHEWQAVCSSRVQGLGCPLCSNRAVGKDNSLARLFPRIAREWHPKNELTAADVVPGSGKKAWWRCKAGHEWETVIYNRAKLGHNCPYCSHQRVTPEISIAALAPHLIEEWHPTKNGDLRPESVGVGSSKLIWWKCSKGPDHEWRVSAHNRARLKHGCPFCSNQRVSITNSLATTAPHLVSEWHPTLNELTPRTIVATSNKKVWWKCPNGPDHEWLIHCLCRTKLGSGCPFCANLRVSVTNCLAKRAPRVARQWHPTKNRPLTPRDVIATSEKQYWWQCVAGHDWKTSCAKRVREEQGCPHCRLRKRPVATKNKPRRWVHLPNSQEA